MSDSNAGSVLVVDDDPSVLETVAAILSRSGYAVVAVGDVAEAIDRLHEATFDVMLTDLRLESASGLSLIAELRRLAPDTLAIILTGYASLESAVDALREGVYDYLIKPCAVAELKATVHRAVERRRLGLQLQQRVRELDESNAKLASFNAELYRRVEEATGELQRRLAELDEANRRLEEIQTQREAMVSMIAHELGQPLTVLRSYAQWLSRPNVPPDRQAQALNAIVAGTRRLERLIRDLSDYSLLIAGRFQIEPAPCDLVEVAREQVELAQVAAQRHVFRLETPIDSLLYRGDRDRLGQVLANLLGNAIKYAEPGEVRVSLHADPAEIHLSVADQGPGIPPQHLTTIFEPYRRLTNRDAPSGIKGTGLGLFISRGVVEAHGGRIWAEAGPGATFVIALPRDDVRSAESPDSTPNGSAAGHLPSASPE